MLPKNPPTSPSRLLFKSWEIKIVLCVKNITIEDAKVNNVQSYLQKTVYDRQRDALEVLRR